MRTLTVFKLRAPAATTASEEVSPGCLSQEKVSTGFDASKQFCLQMKSGHFVLLSNLLSHFADKNPPEDPKLRSRAQSLGVHTPTLKVLYCIVNIVTLRLQRKIWDGGNKNPGVIWGTDPWFFLEPANISAIT